MLPVSDNFQSKLNDTFRKIVKRIEVYDTKFAYPSKGIKFVFYEWDKSSGDPDFSTYSNLTRKFPEDSNEYGTLANLVLNWNTGTPFNIPCDNFAIEFEGFFYIDSKDIDQKNKLKFYFAGNGTYFDFDWNNGSVTKSKTILNTIDSENYEKVEILNPTSGWFPFKIHIWGSRGIHNGGFVALYNFVYEEDVDPDYVNIASNGSVNGGSENWYGTLAYITTDYYDAPACLRIYSRDWPTNTEYASCEYKLDEKLIYNNKYYVSFAAKFEDNTATPTLTVGLTGSSEKHSFTLTDTWQVFSCSFTIDNINQIDSFITFTLASTKSFYVDALVVKKFIKTNYYEYDLIPINAGVVNISNSFLSPSIVKSVIDIEGEKKINDLTEYRFKIPLGNNGYVLNSNNDLEYINDSSIKLSEGNLIKIYIGYEVEGSIDPNKTIGIIENNYEYIPRATLIIDKFKIDRKENVITVICKDILYLAEQQFCINYPDASSYWTAGYLSRDYYLPDSKTFIRAYDKWRINKALQDLLIKANIPAKLLQGKEYRKDKNGDIVETTNLILNKDDILEFDSYQYGSKNYNDYNYYFDLGTRIYEALLKITDTYGFSLESRWDGFIRINYNNNATLKINGQSYSDTTGTVQKNIRAQSGQYLELSSSGDYAIYNFAGTGFGIIFARNQNSGLNDNNNLYFQGTPSVRITLYDSDNNSVLTEEYNLYYNSSEYRFFFDGVDYDIGVNPCFIKVKENLTYDAYRLKIEVINGNYSFGIEQIWIYNYTYTEIVKTFNTYKDVSQIAVIGKLDFERGLDNFRNDILVIGKRRTVPVPAGETQTEQNQTYENIHSRDIDINSIYNSFSSNYIGRNIMTYIQEPTITSYAKAKWLSYNILMSYRNKKMHPNFSVYGDPTIELKDCVSVKDLILEDGSQKFWINGISEKIENNNWEVDCSLIGVEPFPSYESNADFDLDVFNNHYLVDFDITDFYDRNRGNGNETNITNTISNTLIYVEDVTVLPNAPSYVVVYSPNDYPYYGLFYYTSKDDVNNTLSGNFIYDNISDWSTADYTKFKAASAYNIYESEDFNNAIKIKFTALVEGEISVGIRKYGKASYVAGISGNGELVKNKDGLLIPDKQKVYPGEEIIFYWSGVDQTGISYDYDNEENDDKIEFKNFLADSGKYYVEIKYTNYNDFKTITYVSSDFLIDEQGNKIDSKYINLVRSATDAFDLDLEFVRDINLEYDQSSGETGNNGGKTTVTLDDVNNLIVDVNEDSTHQTTSEHINYIYVSTDRYSELYNEGDILIKIKQLLIQNIERKYWIRLHPFVYRIQAKKNPSKNEIQAFHIDTFTFKESFINNGQPIILNDSNWRIFAFNPKSDIWGGEIDVDEDFNKYINDVNFNKDTYMVAYFLVVGIEVVDASGRRCKFTDDGEEPAWNNEYQTIGGNEEDFKKYKWNRVFKRGKKYVTLDWTNKYDEYEPRVNTYYDISENKEYPYIELLWIPNIIHYHSLFNTTGFFKESIYQTHADYAFGGSLHDRTVREILDDEKHWLEFETKVDNYAGGIKFPFKFCWNK